METKRIDWIDIAKGIGIILVVLGHLIVHGSIEEDVVKTWIQSFHMPLFFFISGYLLNLQRKETLKMFLAKKVKSLIIPYAFFSTVSIIYWNIRLHILNQPINMKYMIKCLFCYEGRCGFNDPLWFLLCLFLIEVSGFILFNNKNFDMRAALILSIVLGIGFSFIPMLLPFKIDTAVTMMPFYIMGHITKKEKILERIDKKIYIAIFFLINFISSHFNGMINIYGGEYGNVVMMYMSAFFGVVVILLISKYIKESLFLAFLGRNSLLIMATHFFVFDVYRFIGIKFFGYNFMNSESLIISIAVLVISCIIYIPIIKFFNRFLKFAVGK